MIKSYFYLYIVSNACQPSTCQRRSILPFQRITFINTTIESNTVHKGKAFFNLYKTTSCLFRLPNISEIWKLWAIKHQAVYHRTKE